jgi:hypothetical protein
MGFVILICKFVYQSIGCVKFFDFPEGIEVEHRAATLF